MIYEFAATQDLHGYAKPWAPGAGANLWDEDWEVGGLNITNGSNYPSNSSIRSKNYVPVTGGTQFYNYAGNATAMTICFYDENKDFISAINSGSTNTVRDIPETASYLRFSIPGYGTTYRNNISLNYPATVTTYSPYSNICPPEGYNIWDPTQDQMTQVYSGYVDAAANKLYLHPVYEEYDGEELVGPWMSSMDEYTEEGTPTEGAFVIDFGGEVTEYDITDFMLQTLLDSLGIRRFITSGATLLNSLMDQAQGRVRSEEELLNRSLPLHVIAIGDQLPAGITFKPISKDVLPGLPGKFIR